MAGAMWFRGQKFPSFLVFPEALMFWSDDFVCTYVLVGLSDVDDAVHSTASTYRSWSRPGKGYDTGVGFPRTMYSWQHRTNIGWVAG